MIISRISNSKNRSAGAVALVAALSISMHAIKASPVNADEGGIASKSLLATSETILGQPIIYPSGSAAKIDAELHTVRPGAETPWHIHNIPMFAYILEGEITVNYGDEGTRIYRRGDALIEAISTPHQGHNSGSVPTQILVVNIGRDGVPNAVVVEPPSSAK